MKNTIELEKKFKEECRVVSMVHEYPGYVGEVKWIIFSSLAEDDLKRRYEGLIASFTPYVYMSMDQYSPVREFNNNDRKHRRRTEETYDIYDVEDMNMDRFHPELASEDVLYGEYDDLYSAIEKLPDKQRKRIAEKYLDGKTNREIAEDEGTTEAAVSISLKIAIKNLKKMMTEA